jgi:hypothetical protein
MVEECPVVCRALVLSCKPVGSSKACTPTDTRIMLYLHLSQAALCTSSQHIYACKLQLLTRQLFHQWQRANVLLAGFARGVATCTFSKLPAAAAAACLEAGPVAQSEQLEPNRAKY